jgi:DNA-binding MarR family transcriptional regulator
MLEQCLCTKLRRLTRRITAIYDAHLLPQKLTISQYSLLSRVGNLGPIANIALAAELGMDRSTLSRSIKPLMTAGWIKTVDMPAGTAIDKRSFALALSESGRAKWREALPIWQAAQIEIKESLGEHIPTQLLDAVDSAYALL